jgi:hypothetical protein
MNGASHVRASSREGISFLFDGDACPPARRSPRFYK